MFSKDISITEGNLNKFFISFCKILNYRIFYNLSMRPFLNSQKNAHTTYGKGLYTFRNSHVRIIKYSPVYSTFCLQISTRDAQTPSFAPNHPLQPSRSSRSLIRLPPHFQIFHLPSRALRGGSREKYLAASRDGLCGISADRVPRFLSCSAE